MQSLVCFLEITDHLPHRALNRDALGSCLSMPVFQSSAFQTSVGRNITGELEENQRTGSHFRNSDSVGLKKNPRIFISHQLSAGSKESFLGSHLELHSSRAFGLERDVGWAEQ